MLRAQAARRMLLASLAAALVASLAGAWGYGALASKAARTEARSVETSYAADLRQLDADWQRQAFRQKARLDFLDLPPEPERRMARLKAYLTSQGEEQQFGHVFLLTAELRPVFVFGPDAARLAALAAASAGEDWAWDDASGMLYRVYRQAVWLGADGPGVLVLFRVLDDALLHQMATARTSLRLVWEGRTAAQAVRAQAPGGIFSAKEQVDASIPWPGTKRPAPVLEMSHVVDAPVSGLEVAGAVAGLLALQAACIWAVLGRWLMGVGWRAALLGLASLRFARGLAEDGLRSMEIPGEVVRRDDEIAQAARSLQALTEAVVDRDARRQATQEELARLRALLADVFDSMPSALITVDVRGRVLQLNRSARLDPGRDPSRALGEDVQAHFPRLEALRAHLGEAMRLERVWTGHRLSWKRDGETRLEDATIYPLAGEGPERAVIRLDDVTERTRMEQMMVQSEKMLSVGGLAAGMAHEINNPLGGIVQSAQVIERRVSPELAENRRVAEDLGCRVETVRAYLDGRGVLDMLGGIRESALRAARIVSGMLDFSRRSDAPFAPADVGEILEKALELCSKDYDLRKRFDFRSIRIERRLDPDLPPVPCSANQIEQVLMNLLRNAAQAMEANPPERPPCIGVSARRDGDFAVISVEDNGPGLDEAARRRVFEPFFTTKPPGVGTGLGLSVSYFIVTENHGGSMDVETTPGTGARFVVRLPLAGAAPSEPL